MFFRPAAQLALDCVYMNELPMGAICHSMTATLAVLSSDERCAVMIAEVENNPIIKTLLALTDVKPQEDGETDVTQYDVMPPYAGSIRATACAAIAFLCCHPMGATGEDCFKGPHRMVRTELN